MMRRLLAASVAVLFFALACAPGRAVNIERVVSDKGVTAWFVRDRSVPLVALSFAFRRSGTSTDPEGRGGLARMVSGLLDEGAGDMDSQTFQRSVEEIAARMGFSAGRDEFGGRLQTLSAERDRAFELLRLALTAPRFDAEPVARVRRQILAAIRRGAENPRRIGARLWRETLFPGHPYGRPGSGTAETVAAITAADLREFVRARFTRDRLVVGVVGDISPNELRERLDRVFGGLPDAAPRPFGIARTAAAGAGRTRVARKPNPQSIMLLGHQGIARDDPDWHAAVLVTHVLGGGQASRLYGEVRERRGLAYSVSAGLSASDGAALVSAQLSTRNARASESLGIVRSEWQRIAEHGITEEELRDAKSYVQGSFPLRLDSGRRIAGMLVGLQLARLGIDYIGRRADLFEGVTLNDANRVARKLFRARDLTVVVVGDPAGISEVP